MAQLTRQNVSGVVGQAGSSQLFWDIWIKEMEFTSVDVATSCIASPFICLDEIDPSSVVEVLFGLVRSMIDRPLGKIGCSKYDNSVNVQSFSFSTSVYRGDRMVQEYSVLTDLYAI
nr:hypothetical protein Iba_chr10bCG10730 [Ipomoea batatas]